MIGNHKMSLFSFSNIKKTFFVLTVVILLVTLKLFERMEDSKVKLKRRNAKRWTETGDYGSVGPPSKKDFLKVFHLDLKGAPPKMAFLLSVLPLVSRSGANAILIEYEDMFPFSGRLRNVSAENAYSARDVERLLSSARSLNMEVIPLVQTFGHLEYVLKLEEFRHLREVDSFPQEICPSNREAVELVKDLVTQVMALHNGSRYVHIGCDEVRNIAKCPRCSRSSNRVLFSKHVTRIAEFVRSKYPGVTPLIWDDMLRNWPYAEVADSGLAASVEPVVWVYGNNIFTLVPPFSWNAYRAIFPRIWVASAFKGAFGEKEILPNLSRHLDNNLSWMRVLSGDEEEVVPSRGADFSGIFLTGWSRYDHFAVLCELLPVSVPSLVLGLVFLESRFAENRSEGFSKWLSILGCPEDLLPEGGDETSVQYRLGNCSFPGSRLYSAVVELSRLRTRVSEVSKAVDEGGWTSRYNVRKKFSSPWRLSEMFPEEGFAGRKLRRAVGAWRREAAEAMEELFDRATAEEWEEQNARPMEERLEEIRKDFDEMTRRKTWPRRPLR